jgi:hypothetical protein
MSQVNKATIVSALQRCLEAEPTVNYCLSPDASSLASVLAEMNYFGRETYDTETLSVKKKAAFQRWG